MDIRESLGEGAPTVSVPIPRLGLPGPERGRRLRLDIAFAIALLLHGALFFLLVRGAQLFSGASSEPRIVAAALPTPVRVVFYPPSAAPTATPASPTADLSDQDRRARSEIEPRERSRSRQPAARGRSEEPVPELRAREREPRPDRRPPRQTEPAEPPPEPSSPRAQDPEAARIAALKIPDTLLAAAAAAANARNPGSTSAGTAARQPSQPSGFGSEALDQAIQRMGFGNDASGVGETGPLDFDVKDFEWGPYARKIYEIVDRNWKSVIPLAARMPGVQGKCKVRFRIARSGRLTAITLLDSSGRLSLDQAAVASIELSDPLPPLPPNFPADDVGVTFAYFYNMPIQDPRSQP